MTSSDDNTITALAMAPARTERKLRSQYHAAQMRTTATNAKSGNSLSQRSVSMRCSWNGENLANTGKGWALDLQRRTTAASKITQVADRAAAITLLQRRMIVFISIAIWGNDPTQRQPPESAGGAQGRRSIHPRLANGKRGGCSLQRS